ncbi:MAG: hypothetical protein K8R23_01425 [Chthoniobacter sp.]|nr:hypothetical protein [Chthoniobacter sp.]
MNLYRTKDWLTYRAACIEAADGVCQRCGESELLQVHHPEYISGRKPWEYPIEHCEVLCRGCHAREHGKILPKDGWEIMHSDLEDNEPSDPVPCANCEREIRWHVTVYHPEWGETIVGTECAENLSLGSEMVALLSYHRRINAFIRSPRWKPVADGFVVRQKGYHVVVYEQDGAHWITIGAKIGKIPFATVDAAKQRVFEVIESRIMRAAKA